MSGKRSSAGGAAMGGGAEYQARVAAWLMTYMLAEQDAELPFQLTSPIRWIGCETTEDVDDILVRTESGHIAALQTKRTVSLDKQHARQGKLTPFASAVDQCVRQYLGAGAAASAGSAAMLDATHDRIVLVVGAESPESVKHTLRKVVAQVCIQPAGEPLSAPTLSAAERKALAILLDHARQSWAAEAGREPSDIELHEFIRLVRVESVAVEDAEAEEREAKRILRASVLRDPNQAEQAWSVLRSIAHGLLTERASIDRQELIRKLEIARIHVRAPRSFREDIERLRRHSATVLGLLADYASVQLGADRIELDRPYSAALQEAAVDGSLLIVGEPGIGKSGVMYDAAKALKAAGHDIVVLAAQDPPFTSLGELRDELRLEHDVVEVLANWPSERSAFLFIDALDAARTDPTSQALRRLMADVVTGAGRWRVIASIREYDARYGRDLRRTFAGEPPRGPCPPLAGPEFDNLRHLVVGRLTAPELAQLSSKSPALHTLVSTAPPLLVELFSNVFNLRLAAELLDSGTAPEAIRAVGSQLQLLDLYWAERVIGAGDSRESHAREAVLKRGVEGMVRDRTLRVDWDRVADDPAASPALADLLHAHVLTEWAPAPGTSPDRSTLTFAHHVLFDYAVARVLLRVAPGRLAALLVSDPSLVLLARPSLVMHSHYLWNRGPESRRTFWESVLILGGTAGIPEIGKLIGPAVAAGLVRGIVELEPLTTALKTGDLRREAAENALSHLVRALIAEEGSAWLQEGRSQVWCDFAEHISQELRRETAYPLHWLLSLLADKLASPSPRELAILGSASRRLLEFAWRAAPRDRSLVVYAIQHVSRTFGSDPASSAALLRRALEPEHLAAHGSEEMFWIAQEVDTLLQHDADLVRDIYVAAHGYRENSEAPSPMGGIVLPLVSNRRQDYDGALYSLKQAYPAFLKTAPASATVALGAALEAHSAREHFGIRPRQELRFGFHGTTARLLPDYSGTWDRGTDLDDHVVELLDELDRYLSELAGAERPRDALENTLEIVVSNVRHAAAWRRLLELGARFPTTAGTYLRELAWTPEILTTEETSTAAGEFIGAILPHLTPEERANIEHAVVALPNGVPTEQREWAQRDRDRLLGCMAEMEFVTERGRQIYAQLRAGDAVPSSDYGIGFFTGTVPYGEEEFLAERGVPVKDAVNRRIHDLEEPLKAFASRIQKSKPDTEAIEKILPHLQELRAALESGDAGGAHPDQLTAGWDVLADAASVIARTEGLRCDRGPGAIIRGVLLDASQHPDPTPEPDADAKFNRPSWGRPAPRIPAAVGLVLLASAPECADTEILASLDRLTRDPSPPVRFQVARALHRLYRSAPDLCWDHMERMAAEDRSLGVLDGLVTGPLSSLRYDDAERVMKLALRIYDRVRGRREAKDVRKGCANILAWIYLWKDSPQAETVIGEIADRPAEHLEEALHLVHYLRGIVAHGPTDGSEPNADRARRRGLDVLLRVTRSAKPILRAAVQSEDGALSDDRAVRLSEDDLRSLAHLLDAVGADLFFQSGAYKAENRQPVGEDVQARLLREAGPIIDQLADVGLAHLAHQLFETLEVMVSYDPRGVFVRIAAVIRGARKSGYQHDSVAERVLVRVVERYLADYRAIFKDDEELRRALMEVLDTFVGAGSLGARRLSYGLAEIFR